jgi:hypothetical protein
VPFLHGAAAGKRLGGPIRPGSQVLGSVLEKARLGLTDERSRGSDSERWS